MAVIIKCSDMVLVSICSAEVYNFCSLEHEMFKASNCNVSNLFSVLFLLLTLYGYRIFCGREQLITCIMATNKESDTKNLVLSL